MNFSQNNANVTISKSDCVFSGYAWSEAFGWADFANVKCDLNSGNVSGYATFLNDSSIIDFNSTPYNSSVNISGTGYFSGYAWSETLGWINFTGVYSPLFPLPSVGGNIIYMQFGLIILTILAIYIILWSIKRRKTL